MSTFRSQIKKDWVKFVQMEFPEEGFDEDDHFDLLNIDSVVAGLIDSYIESSLDSYKIQMLRRSESELKLLIENLWGESRVYFVALLKITEQLNRQFSQ